MEHHIEKERRFFQSQKGLKEDEMTGTADGKEFSEPLNHSKKESLRWSNRSLLSVTNLLGKKQLV
jgi:hypothetical protein